MGGVTAPVAGSMRRPAWTAVVSISNRGPLLDFPDLFLFRRRRLVKLAHVCVGHLLDLVVRAALFVFGDDLVFEEFLDRLVAVAADVADRHAMVLGYSVELLHQLLAALFVERRNRDADQLAIVGGIEAEISRADGFFNGPDLGDVPRLDRDQRWLGNVQVAELVERRGRAVVIDPYMVENADRSAARADDGHVVLEVGDGL